MLTVGTKCGCCMANGGRCVSASSFGGSGSKLSVTSVVTVGACVKKTSMSLTTNVCDLRLVDLGTPVLTLYQSAEVSDCFH